MGLKSTVRRRSPGRRSSRLRRDVRAVGEPHRHNAVAIELVGRGGRPDELRQLVGAARQIFLIEHTLREAPEESRRATLEHLATRAQ